MNTPQSSENEPVNVQLCSHHYMQWYKEIHTVHIKCRTYGKSIQNYRKSHIFPEPELVQHFLRTNTDFLMSSTDCVCLTCYKVMYKLHQPCVWTCQNRADRPSSSDTESEASNGSHTFTLDDEVSEIMYNIFAANVNSWKK